MSNENPNYAVETIKLNPDGTRVVKFTTQFPDGNLSKLRQVHFFQRIGQIKVLLILSIKLVTPQLLDKEAQQVKRYIVV